MNELIKPKKRIRIFIRNQDHFENNAVAIFNYEEFTTGNDVVTSGFRSENVFQTKMKWQKKNRMLKMVFLAPFEPNHFRC